MADVNVVRRGMLFGDVIPEVALARSPVDAEVATFDLVLDPVESHVNCFGPSLVDGLVDNPISRDVVGDHRGGWLWVAHFGQSLSEDHGFLAVDEKAA